MRIDLAVLIVSLAAGVSFAAEPPNFDDQVLPIFRQHCNACHNPDKHTADLDLTTYKGVLKGGSGGEVVKAGVPDASRLYEAIVHADQVEPMPPDKPKMVDTQIEIIHRWIAGGLLEAEGGRSKLRNVAFNLTPGSMIRPEDPAVPIDLPTIPLAETIVTPPILALASSPWTNLIAASGHEQILLFGEQPAAIEADDFEPVAKSALLLRREFDNEANEGKVGPALFTNKHRELQDLSTDFLVKNGAFSFTAWIKPDADAKGETIFGRYSFAIYLEKTRNGWRIRAVSRSKDNKIRYFGRVGEFTTGALATHCRDLRRQGVGVPSTAAPRLSGNRFPKTTSVSSKTTGHSFSPVTAITMIVSIEAGSMTYGFTDGRSRRMKWRRSTETSAPHWPISARCRFPKAMFTTCGSQGMATCWSRLAGRADIRGRLRFTTSGPENAAPRSPTNRTSSSLLISAPIIDSSQSERPQRKSNSIRPRTGNCCTRSESTPTGSPPCVSVQTADCSPPATGNGGIHVWESETAGIVYTLSKHKARITGLSWRADGNLLASGAADGKFVLWDMKDGFPTRTASPHTVKQEPSRYTRQTGILDITFARDGRFLTTGRDRTLRWWQTDGNAIGEVRNLNALPTKAVFGWDGKVAVAGDLNGRLRVWNTESRSLVQELYP